MGKAAWGKCAGVVVVVAAVVAAGLLVGLTGTGVARGSTAPQPQREKGRAAPIALDSPTPVSELTNLRTAYSSTYQLSNGARRAEISAVPIHWKDAQGNWQNFDTSLVAGSATGSFTTKATPFGVNLLANPSGGAAATLSDKGYTIGFQLSGANESAGTASGNALTFPAVATDTSESYRIISSGLEQTLTLASDAAPNSFSCTLSHPGLTLKQDKQGAWGLYEPGADSPLMVLSDILVSDSSKDANGMPAICGGATMSVTPGSDASTLTYTVPRSWLSDSARVYPVRIDPMAYFTTWNPNTNTSVYSATPTTSYGTSNQLTVGYNGTGYWRSLLYFNLSSIPTNAYVHATDLELYQDTSGGSTPTTYVGALNEAFSASSTWSSLGCTVNSFPSSFATTLGSVSVGTSGYKSFWMTNLDYTVQKWVSGAQVNDGVALWQAESGNSSADLAQYYSTVYGSNAPYLYVEYDVVPQASVTINQSNYRLGDQVTATMTLNTMYPWDVYEEQLQIYSGGTYHGRLAWFAFNPNTNNADGVSWVTQAESFGYLAYEAAPGTTYGTEYITPNLAASSIYYGPEYWQIVFVFNINNGSGNVSFGSSQNNNFQTYFGMDADGVSSSGSESYISPWQAPTGGSPTFTLTSSPVTALSYTTTANSTWWNPSAGPDNTNGQGRGAVSLNWPAAPGADGYYIYLWDGYQYDKVGSTTSTTWSSSGQGIYPTDTQIANITPGSTSDPFLAGTGVDLRDNPNALYQKMGGTAASKLSTAYQFIVDPYNNVGGALPVSANYPVYVTLDNRSLPASTAPPNDPQYSTYDLGSWDGHDATALLNYGALRLDVTDLSIASYGPDASVSRSYLSASTTAGDFAPGWFFNFQQNLSIGSSTITYTDAEQEQHVFTKIGGVWQAPNGYLATLTQSGSNWKLLFFNQEYLTFSSTGVLTTDTDHDGNVTTYAWSGGNLTITAANGQTIAVTFSGGKIQKAVYTTSAGTREVDYTTASPWQVTYYPSTVDTRVIAYGYNATPTLTSITQNNWPSSGNSAQEDFAYSAGSLVDVYYPDYYAPYSHADAYAALSYSTGQAIVTHYGTVNGTADQPIEKTTDTFEQTGQIATQTTGIANPQTTTYTYAYDLMPGSSTSTDGQQTAYGVSTAGDTITTEVTSNSLSSPNQLTSDTYNSSHQLTSETDYQTLTSYSTTNYTYNSNGDVTDTQVINPSGTVLSDKQQNYNSSGECTWDKDLLSGTPSSGTYSETDYSNFTPSGLPQTTNYDNVQLSYGGSMNTLTVTASYSPFGNLLTETDWSNSRVIETKTYDIAGNELTSTDAYGICTNKSYDCMGNVTSSWKSASGTSQLDDWTATTYDPQGNALAVTIKTSNSSGTLTTEKVVTNTYDGVGDEQTSSDSTVGGQPEKWLYDDCGNVVDHWAMGVYDYSTARATRDTYTVAAQVSSESDPGNANAPGQSGSSMTSYDSTGTVTQQTNPDGSWEKYQYNGTDDSTTTTFPLTQYNATSDPAAIASTTSTYTPNDEESSATEAASNSVAMTTQYGYDEAGEPTSAQGSGVLDTSSPSPEPSAITVYDNNNMLGWVLQVTSADGVVTQTTYDTHGNVSVQKVGSKSTSTTSPMTYNADNQLLTETDADGNTTTNTYDAFGDLTEAKCTSSGSTVLKDLKTTPDSLGRPVSQTNTVTGLSHSWTYPVNSATGTQETVNYDSTPLTSLATNRNARNVETSRVATIASGNTVTRSIADSTSGRDMADRWISASIQETGQSAITMGRTFNNAGDLTAQSGAGYTSGDSASYTWDPATGQLDSTSVPISLSGTLGDTYAYYPDGRLAYDNQTDGYYGQYQYDSFGNLIAENWCSTPFTYQYNPENQLTASTESGVVTDYGYDTTNGWRTSQGPTSNPSQIQYAYNALGQMTSYSDSATSTTATYSYDAAGERTQSSVTQGGSSWTTSWVYDGSKLMSETINEAGTTIRFDYLYDEDGNLWGGVYRSPATSTSPVYFTVVTDEHGNVRELLDAAGNPFTAYNYTAWGDFFGNGSDNGNYDWGCWVQGTSLIGATTAQNIEAWWPVLYSGYVYDRESNMYYCNARYYDVGTRQWTTPDPANADGQESTYQYCMGDPAEEIDPTGLANYVIWKNWNVDKSNFEMTKGKISDVEDCHLQVQVEIAYHNNKAGDKWVIDQYALFSSGNGAQQITSNSTDAIFQTRTGAKTWGDTSSYTWGSIDIGAYTWFESPPCDPYYNGKYRLTTPYYLPSVNYTGPMTYTNKGNTYTGTRVFTRQEIQWGSGNNPAWSGKLRLNINLPESESKAAAENTSWRQVVTNTKV